jgi:hypothetical protein
LNSDIKVQVTAHSGYIIINTIKPDKDKNFVPNGNGRVGCVLTNTKKHLGMSNEAFKLLKTVKKSGDDIGDVMAYHSGDQDIFGWLGPVKRLVNPVRSESDSTGIQDIEYIEIPNKPPLEAVMAIDMLD